MFSAEAMAGYAVTAIFTLINLAVTYFILKKFLFKPILNVLRKRRVDVETELNQAAEKLTTAESKLAEADERLQNSSHEAAMILSNARSQAETQGESILADARHEYTTMLTRADTEISRMKTTMLNDLRDEVADLSVAIASKVIGSVMDDSRQRQLVDQFIDEKLNPPKADAGDQGGVNGNA
jgi:F-type H+-transporting ATPase subunit b